MTDTVATSAADVLLPGNPADLHLTVTSEIGPAVEGGGRPADHRLLVRYPRNGEDWRPGASWSERREHVALISIRCVPMAGGTMASELVAELQRDDNLDHELHTAVLSTVLSTRGGRRSFSPAVRSVLGKGPRSALGDLVLLDGFSVATGWANAGLDVLLLGELISRTVTAPAVLATAPLFLTGDQERRIRQAALNAAGFRPLAGHTMVAGTAGLPTLSGPAGQTLTERYRSPGR